MLYRSLFLLAAWGAGSLCLANDPPAVVMEQFRRLVPQAAREMEALDLALTRLIAVYRRFETLPPQVGAPFTRSELGEYAPVWFSLMDQWLERPERKEDFLSVDTCAEWARAYRTAIEETRMHAAAFIAAVNGGYYQLDQLPDPLIAAASYTRGLRYGLLFPDGFDRPGNFLRSDGQRVSVDAVLRAFSCVQRLAEAAFVSAISK